MKKIFFILSMALLLVLHDSFAQNTIVFKGQLYHNQLGPMKRVRVIINNQYPALTDDAGIFQVALAKNSTSARVSMPMTNYQILYPAGGYVAIPRDLKDVPQIIIGSHA